MIFLLLGKFPALQIFHETSITDFLFLINFAMSTKLSKRKQKALAFRGKQKNKSTEDTENEELKAIPTEEESEENPGTTSWLGNDAVKGPSTKRKRKREADDDNTAESSKPVKSKSTTTAPTAKKSKPSTDDTLVR